MFQLFIFLILNLFAHEDKLQGYFLDKEDGFERRLHVFYRGEGQTCADRLLQKLNTRQLTPMPPGLIGDSANNEVYYPLKAAFTSKGPLIFGIRITPAHPKPHYSGFVAVATQDYIQTLKWHPFHLGYQKESIDYKFELNQHAEDKFVIKFGWNDFSGSHTVRKLIYDGNDWSVSGYSSADNTTFKPIKLSPLLDLNGHEFSFSQVKNIFSPPVATTTAVATTNPAPAPVHSAPPVLSVNLKVGLMNPKNAFTVVVKASNLSALPRNQHVMKLLSENKELHPNQISQAIAEDPVLQNHIRLVEKTTGNTLRVLTANLPEETYGQFSLPNAVIEVSDKFNTYQPHSIDTTIAHEIFDSNFILKTSTLQEDGLTIKDNIAQAIFARVHEKYPDFEVKDYIQMWIALRELNSRFRTWEFYLRAEQKFPEIRAGQTAFFAEAWNNPDMKDLAFAIAELEVFAHYNISSSVRDALLENKLYKELLELINTED
jgi:hypothetical protein